NTLFASQTGPIGELIVQPFSPVGVDVFTFPQARADNTFQYADSISWKLGRHSVKFGADIRRVQLNSSQDRNYRPLVEYGNGVLIGGNLVQKGPTSPIQFQAGPQNTPLPGIGLAAIGVPSSIFQTITLGAPDSEIGLRFTEYNFFFNDNWRVASNFALDYGIRYEYNTVPGEVNHKIEDALALKGLPAPGSSIDMPQFTAAFNAVVAAYKQIVGGRTQIYDPDYKNVGPHLGFAWDPFGDGKMSVRAGYGIYYDTILGSVVSQSRNIFPTEVPINADPTFLGFNVFNLNNPVFVKRGNIPLILPGTQNQFGGAPQDFVGLLGSLFLQNGNGGGLAFTLPDKHLRTPYSQQWHLTV
ncbi:MAG: TonB-dependent receptor domain-containing protein, partial [Blastocatellia bacterium]